MQLGIMVTLQQEPTSLIAFGGLISQPTLPGLFKPVTLCQLRQMCNILIPPVVAIPAPLFATMYMNMMHLLMSGGFKYFVQGHCSLTHFPEHRALCAKTAKTLGDWIFEDILC